MNRLEILEKKVRQAADNLVFLKEQKDKLQAELRFLEEENKQNKKIMHENLSLKEKKTIIVGRIEKILKRINSLKI